MNIDYEKAFDSVEWTLIYKALKYFGFPEKYIQWVKVLYTNIETGIMNNGHLSEFFKPSRGVRQGCPLSPSLFVITIELLAVYIRHQIAIKGIRSTKGENYIISQFADDTSFAILNQPGNLAKLFKCLENFTRISGLRINVEKTELLLLGIGTTWDVPKEYRKLVKEEVKVLGIMISTNKQKLIQSNYNPVLEKMKNKASIWSKRKLSLAGKIAIVKSLITSQLVYCITVLPSPPKEYWKEANKILFSFLANNSTEKLKRHTIIGQYKEGGFGMIDIETQNQTAKIGWVKRLLTNTGVWSSYILEKLPNVDLNYILRCNIKYNDLSLKLPKGSIWAEIFEKWCDLNYNDNITGKEMVYNQNIWLNSHIKIGNKATVNQKWYRKGIRWLKDLIHEPENRMLTLEELENKYHTIIPFTEYLGVQKAIPREWLLTIQSQDDQDITEEEEEDYKWIDRLSDHRQHGKLIYNHLLQRKFLPPTAKLEKWNEEMQTNLTMKQALYGLEKNRTTTINNKLRSFNYNFYMRNIPYGTRLKKMGIKDHDTCMECGHSENILHLYWTCPNSSRLWERLKTTVEQRTGITMTLNAESCLMGTYPPYGENGRHDDSADILSSASKRLLRTLSLLTKHYIHLCKCAEQERTYSNLLKYIRETYNIEHRIASNKGTQHLLNKKWGLFSNMFDN